MDKNEQKIPNINIIDDCVAQTQTTRLIENSGINTIAGFLMAVIWVGMMWKNLPHQVLGVWLSMMLVLFVFRVSITYFSWYKTGRISKYVDVLRRWYLMSVLITGAGWGITSILMFPYLQTEQIALSFMLAGVAASGIALSHIAWVYYCYVGFALVPLMIRLFHIGGDVYYAMSALTGLFLCVMVAAAYKMHALSSKELNLSYANVELISDLQCAQNNLETVNHELKDEIETVKKMEIELEQARDKAEQYSEAKSEFLAKMSHEIRTPMNGVIGTLQLLELTNLEEKQKFYVKTACDSAASLMSILNDILDISKIEAGKLTLESVPFDLKRLIDDVITLHKISAEQKQNSLELEIDDLCPDIVVGDPTRIRQILINLVSNAIKFTKSGQIKVNVNVLSQMDNQVEIRLGVSDTGIGIKDDVQKKLFSAFTQADNSTTRNYGGTGLGLAIVKQLVEKMMGSFGLESELEKGSLFWVSFPFVSAGKDVSIPEDTVEGNIEIKLSGNVLLVEDNPVNQLVATKMLENIGLDVVLASNGKEAVECFSKGTFDMVLMDCQMPIMDGFDATRKIREIEENTESPVPIIAMTANVMQGDKELCLDAGMDDYLGKPVQLRQLVQKLQHWMA